MPSPHAASPDFVPMSSFVQFQTASRIDLGVAVLDFEYIGTARRVLTGMTDRVLTYYIDFLLSQAAASDTWVTQSIRNLESILDRSGSNWTVGSRRGRWGLVERVPSGVAEVVDSVMSKQDLASGQLRKAWGEAYGVNPSPSHAYHDAVKAVEILTATLISPKNNISTLGTDIRDLRNGKHKWEFVMAGSKHETSVEHLVSVMELLWHSQSDRHGHEDYKDVTSEEAKAAVLLASTLVGWFSQDALRRVEE